MYPGDVANGNGLTFHMSNGRYNFYNEFENDSMAWCNLDDSSYYDANAKIQSDLNVVRDCLGHRLRTEEQAISSLLAGN